MKSFNFLRKAVVLLAVVFFGMGMSSVSSGECPEGFCWNESTMDCDIAPEEGCSGGGSGVKSGEHSSLNATHAIYNGVTKGNYVIFNPPGTNAGTATVTAKNLGSITYVKTSDNSAVGIAGSIYNISYYAYFTVFGGTGAFTVLDGYQVNW